MKTLLLASFLLPASLLFSQDISDVRLESGFFVVYDSNGDRISSMHNTLDKQLKGVTGAFFVLQDDIYIETYDAKCNSIASMLSINKTVRGASGSTFTVEEFGRVIAYDAQCKEVSSFSSAYDKEISEVRIEGSLIVVYNAQGDRVSSMINTLNKQVKGVTGTFFVVQDDYFIETYDVECRRIDAMPAVNRLVTGASGSTFTVEENNVTVVTYNSECEQISVRIKR